MKKQKIAKLKLHRETMGTLENEPLQEAVGGVVTAFCTTSYCPTITCCHTSCK